MDRQLRLDNINFFFKESCLFFANTTISFYSKKIHVITGENGSGKSTLFRLIQGHLKQSEIITGSYSLNNIVYPVVNNSVSDNYKNHVKLLSQDISKLLLPSMTVGENISLARSLHCSWIDKFIIEENIPNFLMNVGVKYNQLVHELSGGQQQLLAFYIGYQNAGNVFLLDEPTAALDSYNSSLLMETIGRVAFQNNLIVIMITHNKELLEKYCLGNHYVILVNNDGTRSIVQQ